MARMLWLKLAAGTSLALSVGCQNTNGPDRNAIMTPPPRFPSATPPGAPTGKSTTPNSSPTAAPNFPVTTPGITDSNLRIATPTAQAITPPPNSPPVAKLRPVDPTVANAPPIEAPPIGENRSSNAFRNLPDVPNADWNNQGNTPYRPVGGGPPNANFAPVNSVNAAQQIAPPPPQASLPPMMPQVPPPFPAPGAAMQQYNPAPPPAFPASEFPPQPAFPTQSYQPQQNPAGNFPTGNVPNAPNLNPQGAGRANIYPPPGGNQ